MIEIRLLGRGGQGAYSSAEMLAHAFVKEGKYAQAFPMFGGERRGAPVNVFLRFDTKPIRLRSQIYYPDCVVVTDPLLAFTPTALSGLKPGGIVVMNLSQTPETKPHENTGVFAVVDATGIALEQMGRAITNTVMLGALIKTTGWAELDSVLDAFPNYYSGKVLENNIVCAKKGFEAVKVVRYGGS
jgi:2-oxoisovalerate ferredoxin oxidoreductase gamma subunit